MSVAGLILAAGESKRMGSPKALLEFRGETFLDRLIALFSEFCHPVVVVVGCEAERIRTGVKRSASVIFAVNTQYSLGQLSSMQCGLRRIPDAASGVLFTLVDHPNVRRSTVEAVLASPLPPLSIPRIDGRRGHPIYFSRELTGEFLALPPDSSAKPVIHRRADRIRYVDVDDPGILDDVDDPAAYLRLVETNG